VGTVSWQQARDYADRLTKERKDQHLYRLPTEAEWEYCCRGGRPSSKPFGVGEGRALSSREANFNGNYPYGGADKGPNLESTSRVGSYAANAFRLYDMHGNVWEWCVDWYGPYPVRDITNPTGPAAGTVRVFRGGGWRHVAEWKVPAGGLCRAAFRDQEDKPGLRYSDIGFRLARAIR
jgi:formylglycine-generating enzyme required for sulfatase activity